MSWKRIRGQEIKQIWENQKESFSNGDKNIATDKNNKSNICKESTILSQ